MEIQLQSNHFNQSDIFIRRKFPRAFPYKNSFFIPGAIASGISRQTDLLLYSPETELGWTKLKENVLDKSTSLYAMGVISKTMLEC